MKIISKINVSKTTVHQAVSKFGISGKYTDLKKSGHPRKTRAPVDHAIRRIVIWSPIAFCEMIKHTLAQRDTIISRSTFQDPWQKSSLYYSIKLQENLYLHRVWKRNNWLLPENFRIGQYNSRVQCYFPMSQISCSICTR